MRSPTKGWDESSVRELIIHHGSGPSPTCEEREMIGDEWGLLKTTAVTWNAGWQSTAHKVPPREYWGNHALEVRPGDVVVTKAGPRHRVGVVAYVDATRPRLMVSGKMVLLRPDPLKVHGRVLAQLLALPGAQKYLDSRTTGMAESQVNFANSALLELRVAVPSMSEQRHITEALDAVDHTIAATTNLIAKLSQRREGALATQVDHIIENSPSTTVAALFDVGTGITLGPHRIPRRHVRGYLRVANVQRECIDLDDVAQVECSPKDARRYETRRGDLLIVEGHANPNEIGRAALVGDQASGLLHQNHLFRLRSESFDPECALTILNGQLCRSYWRRMCATSSGLYTIGRRLLEAMPFPRASRDAQLQLAAISIESRNHLSLERQRLAKLRAIRTGLADDLVMGRVRTVPV